MTGLMSGGLVRGFVLSVCGKGSNRCYLWRNPARLQEPVSSVPRGITLEGIDG